MIDGESGCGSRNAARGGDDREDWLQLVTEGRTALVSAAAAEVDGARAAHLHDVKRQEEQALLPDDAGIVDVVDPVADRAGRRPGDRRRVDRERVRRRN